MLDQTQSSSSTSFCIRTRHNFVSGKSVSQRVQRLDFAERFNPCSGNSHPRKGGRTKTTHVTAAPAASAPAAAEPNAVPTAMGTDVEAVVEAEEPRVTQLITLAKELGYVVQKLNSLGEADAQGGGHVYVCTKCDRYVCMGVLEDVYHLYITPSEPRNPRGTSRRS